MKTHIIFVDDHSGSMSGSKAQAALADSNVQRKAIRESANREMQDTIISVLNIGIGNGPNGSNGMGVEREIVASNPHVLKNAKDWPTPGGTPLWDAIADAIDLTESMPDYKLSDVSYLIITTTDGVDAYSQKITKAQLAVKIAKAQATGRYTFVFRIPVGSRVYLRGLNVPPDNIREWDNTAAGLEAAATATATATSNFYTARSAGATSSSSFYTNASAVNTNALTDISKEVSLYTVPSTADRVRIDDFILGKRSTYLKGAAFYQLVKSEARVGPKKIVLIRERAAPNRIYAGKEARTMLNLPNDPTSNARVHPGDHGSYDIFIQSDSLNRLLPAGTGVVYWEKQGVPFTQADIDLFKPKTPANAPAAPVLPAVVGRTKPTPSPVPKAVPAVAAHTVNGKAVNWFATREQARKAGQPKDRLYHSPVVPAGPRGERWFVYL